MISSYNIIAHVLRNNIMYVMYTLLKMNQTQFELIEEIMLMELNGL